MLLKYIRPYFTPFKTRVCVILASRLAGKLLKYSQKISWDKSWFGESWYMSRGCGKQENIFVTIIEQELVLYMCDKKFLRIGKWKICSEVFASEGERNLTTWVEQRGVKLEILLKSPYTLRTKHKTTRAKYILIYILYTKQ